MKSLRIIALATTAMFLGTTLFAQGQLDRKPRPGQGNNGPSRPSTKPSSPPPRQETKPPSRPDPKPSSPPPRQETKPPSRPDVKPSNPPSRPDNDLRPRPRPDIKPDQRPPTRPETKPDQRPPTRPDNRPPTRPDVKPDERPPVRPDNRPPIRPDNDNRPPTRPNLDRNPRINEPPRQNTTPQLGRVERPNSRPSAGRPSNENLLERRSRNTYGGQVSNQNSGDRGNRGGQQFRIDRAPVDIFRGGLEHQVRREDRIRLISSNRYRSGYYHYRRDWCDDYFWFGGYIFNPFNDPYCYVSPWYYYGHLPAYVSHRRVTVINISLNPWYGTTYQWRRPASYTWDNWSNFNSLDYALEDVTRSFERVDYRALRRLIPDRDRVAIFVDGEYTYSMEPYDFEEFMIDAIENTQTVRYEITSVQRRGREAEIRARHDYEDAYGRPTTVYHYYRLEEERQGFVIRRFGTSYYPR